MIWHKLLLMASDSGPKLKGIIFTNRRDGGSYAMSVKLTYEAQDGSQKTSSFSVASGQSRDCSDILDAVRPIRAEIDTKPGYCEGATWSGAGVSGISGSGNYSLRTVNFNASPPWECEIVISVGASSG